MPKYKINLLKDFSKEFKKQLNLLFKRKIYIYVQVYIEIYRNYLDLSLLGIIFKFGVIKSKHILLKFNDESTVLLKFKIGYLKLNTLKKKNRFK